MKRTMKNECYSCKHRRGIPGDAHTKCAKPNPDMKGNEHGKRNGWFNYSYNFDPVLKEKNCSNYEEEN